MLVSKGTASPRRRLKEEERKRHRAPATAGSHDQTPPRTTAAAFEHRLGKPAARIKSDDNSQIETAEGGGDKQRDIKTPREEGKPKRRMESLLSSAQPLSPPVDTGDMSTVPFERYDEEFLSLSEQVRRSLSSLDNDLEGGSPPPPGAESDLKMASNLLSQCDDLLKQMGLEARGADDADAKRELLAKVGTCKAKLGGLRSDYDAARAKVDRSTLGLDPAGSANGGGLSNDHRERLLRTSDQLSAQNETLENARRVMADTEGVALEITEELGRNREKIESAHGRVRDVSGLTNRARRIVQSMNRREVQQKLAMYVVSFVLIIVVIVIMFGMR